MADLNKNSNYTFADIERYVSGTMTAPDMHDIERAALQDPFLADAIDGYREADKKTSEKHLNEIRATLQGNKQEATVINMPKRKTYKWQIAASFILLAGISTIFLTKKLNKQNPVQLASNRMQAEQKDTLVHNHSQSIPSGQDSLFFTPGSSSSSLSKQKKTTVNRDKTKEKKGKPEPDFTASASPSKTEDATVVASAPATYKAVTLNRQQPVAVTTDTSNNINPAQTIVTGYAMRKAGLVHKNEWTTDKGKPFILSEVEVINMGRKNKKITDTSSIKPEGGWQSFQNYLFSKLNKKDSAAFANATNFEGNLELEFSFNETGLPYNVKVLHAQDSTTANTVVTAIEQGPKWISADKKEKRLNIKY